MTILNLKLASDSASFKILAETEVFCVGHEFEDAYLINKKKKEEIYLGDFYGDPTCAVISSNNDWCAVGGEYLLIWHKDKGITKLERNYPNWILELKQKSDNEIEMHIEVEYDVHDVWLMNIPSLEKTKVDQLII